MTVSKTKKTQTNPNSLANLRPYAPGVSGNLNGKPKSFLTKDKVAQLLGKLFDLPPSELLLRKQDPTTSTLEITVIGNILTAIERGALPDLLMAYAIGKPAEVHQIETKKWDEELQVIPIETLKALSKGTDE